MAAFLFDKGSSPEAESPAAWAGKPRLRAPIRDQVEIHCAALDELLEPNHPARTVWAAVCGLDLGRWTSAIKAVEGNVGRDATDPRVLLALWVYATLEGIGSARELDRLCTKHLAYQWLAGGVTVNYHLLSDFRAENAAAWDELLTQIVGALLSQGLVSMNRVAQDGMRVRADAGKSSFRRRPSLQRCLAEAREQVETLRRLAEESPEELSQRQRAARERAAVEREARIEEALRQCDELQQRREATAKKSCRRPAEARASTTDPEARTMQFSDGGYRPGYNVQFATDTAAGVIVGVDVTAEGTDAGQLSPMLGQLQRRYGRVPNEALVDGGFASGESIRAAAAENCVVYAPLKEEARQLAAGTDPYRRRPGDDDALAAWRRRMGTAAAKTIYRLRAQTAEWVNAGCRNRGLWRMPVRGLAKARIAALLQAITHNLLTTVRLRRAMTT